ncbi:MAG: NAD(P)/FAD-dependent oxidoreductase [Candidatus Pacebacteria bacterium]|nr:NAD(P)/FAD-dependent oxidoreductase [Candidatus Paceibacterota bacterium]
MERRETEDQKYNVAVVGGGPAGMMAAIKAAEAGAKTILIEKNARLGKKLLLSGNGRCNLSNAEVDLRKLTSRYGKNGSFLYHALSVFGPKEAVSFFKEIGIETKAEKTRRIFPVSGKAEDVLNALIKELKRKKVFILRGAEAEDIVCEKGLIKKIVLNIGEISADKYIFCTGGRSYPSTGSDGKAFELIKKTGHSVKNLEPALVPVETKEKWTKALQGVALGDARIIIRQFGKKIKTSKGGLLFTHFGLSGPVILNQSRLIGELLKFGEVKISIDISPSFSCEQIENIIKEGVKSRPNEKLKNFLADFMPRKMALVMIGTIDLDPNKEAGSLSKEQKKKIAFLLKRIDLTVFSLLGFDMAMATAGGVLLKEIDDKTMRSKIINNLFFAGEIIDIDGETGGFNLQNCWSTGHLAGQSAVSF